MAGIRTACGVSGMRAPGGHVPDAPTNPPGDAGPSVKQVLFYGGLGEYRALGDLWSLAH